MAYSTRRFVKHIDKYGTVHRIEIQQDGYAGGESSIRGNKDMGAFTFEHQEFAAEGEILKIYENVIQKGMLEVYPIIQNSTDFQLLTDIFQSDEDEFRLVWKQDGAVFWTGSVINDLLEFQESAYPYSSTIIAKDFSRLGGDQYTSDGTPSGNLLDNRQTIITTIADLLDYLGYGLDIQTITSWTTENTTDSVDFLQQIYHETKALREFGRTEDEEDQPITVLEALRKVLQNFGLILRQSDNQFQIEQVTEYEDPTAVNVTVYDSTGTQKTAATSTDKTQDASANNIIVKKQGTRTKGYPAIKRAEVRWSHRTKVSRVDQKTFELDDSTNTNESVSDVIISDGDQTLDFGIVAGGSRSGSLSESILRYSIFMAGYWWDQSDYNWVPDTGTEVKNEVDLTNTTNKPTLTLWIGGEAYETDNIPTDADGIMTVKAYIPTGLEEANVTVFLDITNPQAIENSKFVEYKITQQDGYSTDFQLNDTWFGDGPLAYSVAALRYGTGDGDITQDSWQRRGTTTGYRNFHENLLKEVMDVQRSWTRKINAALHGVYDPTKVLVYRGSNYFYTGGQFNGASGDWNVSLMQLSIQTASTDDYDDVPRFREDNETGTSSTEESTTTGGISQNEGDARYFRQSQAFDELATADIDTALTNLGLKDGSRDLDLNSLDINNNSFVDGSRNVDIRSLTGSVDGVVVSLNSVDNYEVLKWRRETASTNYGYLGAGSGDIFIGLRDSGGTNLATLQLDDNATGLKFRHSNGTFETVWTAGNDGSGSGLDADLWDGNQFADYLYQPVRTTDSVTFKNALFSNDGSFDVGIENGSGAQLWLTTEDSNNAQAKRLAIMGNSDNVGYDFFQGVSGSESRIAQLDADTFTFYNSLSLETDNFSAGWAGTGWQGTYSGDWEAQNLRIRGALRVYEFIAKQLSSIGGTEILSIANAKIQSVNPPENIIRVDNVSGTARTPFKQNDLWIVQVVDINNDLESGGTGSIVYRVYGTVTNTAATDASLDGDQIEVSVDAGSPDGLGALEEQDLIVAYGSTSDTDRQAIMYRNVDRSEDNLIMRLQTGVDAFSALQAEANTRVAFGDLNGYADFTSETFGFFAGDNTSDKMTADASNGLRFLDSSNNIIAQINSNKLTVGDGFEYDAPSNTLNVAAFTVNSQYLTDGAIFIGDDVFSGNNSKGNVLIGNSSVGSDPLIRVYGQDSNNFVSMQYFGDTNWGLVGQKDNNDVFKLGYENQIAGAFFDSTGQWGGGGATSDPATKSDANIWFDWQNGRIYYKSMGGTVYSKSAEAGYNDGDSVTDIGTNSYTETANAGPSVPLSSSETKVQTQHYLRYGIESFIFLGYGNYTTSGGTGSVRINIFDDVNGTALSTNIFTLPNNASPQEIEETVDVSSIGPNIPIVVEVILYAEANADQSTTANLKDNFVIIESAM